MILSLFAETKLPNLFNAITNVNAALKSNHKVTATFKASWAGIESIVTAHPFIVTAAAVGGLVAVLKTAVEWEEKQYEKAKEQADKSKEIADQREEEADRLKTLINQYEELAKSNDKSSETRTQIRDIQKEINSLVHGEIGNLDLINGRLEEQLQTLKDITAEKATQDMGDYIAAFNAAADASDKSSHKVGIDDWMAEVNAWALGSNLATPRSGDDDAAIEILQNAVPGVHVASDIFGLSTDILHQYWKIEGENAKELYENAKAAIEALENDPYYDYSSSKLYDYLVKARDAYQEDYQKASEAAERLIAQNIIELTRTMALNPDEDYEAYKSRLLQALKNDRDLENAISKGFASDDIIGSLLDDYLTDLVEQESEVESGKSPESTRALGDLGKRIESLLNSEDFAETRAELTKLAKSGEITTDTVVDLADKSEELADVLNADGMSARFLAHVLQEELAGRRGLDLITDEALELNKVLDGLTGKFDEVSKAKSDFDKAMEAGEKDDNFKSLADAFETLNNEFVKGTTNSNAFWASAEYLFGTEKLNAWGWANGIDKIYEAMQNTVGVFKDAESAGSGFLDKLYQISKSGEVTDDSGSVLATIEKLQNGSWNFDINSSHIDSLADKMNMSKEAVLACLEALSMFGHVKYYDMQDILDTINDIGLSSDKFNVTAISIDNLSKELNNLGYTNKEINDILKDLSGNFPDAMLFDISESVKSLTSDLIELGIATQDNNITKINTKSLGEFLAQLGYLNEDAVSLITKLANEKEITFVDDAGNIQMYRQSLQSLDEIDFKKTVTEQLNGITESTNVANEAVDELQSNIDNLHGTKVEIDVEFRSESSKLPGLAGRLGIGSADILPNNVHTNGSGISHSGSGRSFAKGTTNAPSGEALVGEEGEELVQSGNHAYFVGTNGAEIVGLKTGDVVYNADETRKIKQSKRHLRGLIPSFRLGGSIGNQKNKEVYLYDGSATDTVNIKADNIEVEGKKYEDLLPNKSTGSSKSKDSEKPEVLDWIEIAIDRITSAVDRLKSIAESTFKSLKPRLNATYDEIAKVNDEIALQQKAYDRYMKEASKVDLPADLTAKVRNGTIDINEYDSDKAELISEYQGWYEKAVECADAIQLLRSDIASLYKSNFENVQKDFENQLGIIEHLTSVYETGIDAIETKGYLASVDLYAALEETTKQNISVLQKEYADLKKYFNNAMASGEIEKYSDAWYDMQSSINDVKEAIDDANVELLEYAKTIREIQWERFDYIQERISKITQDSDFLIDLLSNKNLYQDNGQFTNEGLAATGLHAQNYNVYMAQADQYAEEILSIDKEIANDPYNTDLIERREELLKLQQDSILAAEDEKQAIIDLVEDGIKIELDNLKELIDTYEDSLDSAKDLYDYQRKVGEKTQDIASLQKQLSAYENDTSEEARARIQQIKVDLSEAQKDLEETEYERYISDTKQLLDNLYTEYETILNERLDNIDALFADMIETVNMNGNIIGETINQTANEVGALLSQNMKDIWSGSGSFNNIVAVYGNDFLNSLTTINQVLSSIQANTAAMAAGSDAFAEDITQGGSGGSTSSNSTSSHTSAQQTSSGAGSVPSSSQSQQAKSITVGSKINAGKAFIYDYAGDTTPEYQYFSKDPIYTVLKEQNGYLQVRWHKLNSGVTGWFKKTDVKAYKNGGLVDETGLVQLDGTRSKPELVLNAQDTENFIKLKDTLRQMANQQLKIGDNYSEYLLGNTLTPQVQFPGYHASSSKMFMPSYEATQDIDITFGDIVINHVEDYEDFMNQIRNDPQFEKLIQSITVDRIAGGTKIAKYKYKW